MATRNRFFQLAAATLLLLLILSMVVFAAIDPRGMFNLKATENLYPKKFSFFNNETFIKPYKVIAYTPDFLITGNSIANTAFNPAHPFFAGQKTYSYGMAGAGIYTNYRTYQHILDQPPKKIIHVVDFSAFFSTNPTNNKDFIEKSDTGKRLRFNQSGEKNHSVFLQYIKDYSLLLFSFQIALDSMETIQRQNEDGWFLKEDGTWGGGSSQTGKPQRKRLVYVEKEIFMRPLLSTRKDQPFYLSDQGENTLDYFKKYLAVLYTQNTDTTLLIPPAHARVYETLFVQNRWDNYREWKKAIVLINEELANHHKRPPYPIWDFSGYNQFTTESVPDANDKVTRMQWFYDSVHIKPELGTQVLDTMTTDTQDASFGLKITSLNVDSQLFKMEQDHLAYQKDHPQDSAEIYNLCISILDDNKRCMTNTAHALP